MLCYLLYEKKQQIGDWLCSSLNYGFAGYNFVSIFSPNFFFDIKMTNVLGRETFVMKIYSTAYIYMIFIYLLSS